MQKKRPKVSYVIPCFNQGKFLESAIDSVLKSYTGPKQVVVVNDCSDDRETLNVLQRLSGFHPDVTIINNDKNLGLSAARNLGIRMSLGKYIQLLDADDVILYNKVEYQIKHFNISSNLGVSISDFRISDENLQNSYSFPKENNYLNFSWQDFYFRWESEFIIPIHAALFAREVFDNHQFDETLKGKEDWVFWSTLTKNSVEIKLAYLPFLGAVYRRHDNAMTEKNTEDMGVAWLQAGRILEKELSSEHKESFREYYNYWFTYHYRADC